MSQMSVNVIFIVIYKKNLNKVGVTHNVLYIDLEETTSGNTVLNGFKEKTHLRKNTGVDIKQPLVLSLKKAIKRKTNEQF